MSSADVEIKERDDPHTTHGGITHAARESTFQEVDDRERVTPAIEFKDVTLAFDDRVVLDGLSFTV